MKLNCKVGDLARYVGRASSLRGWHFHVIEPYSHRGIPAWRVEPPPPKSNEYLAIGIVLDASLRPVRGIGDDEKDQSTAYLPPIPARSKDDFPLGVV